MFNYFILRNLRLAKNYSQEYMAEELGMSQNAYWKLENGKTKLNLEKVTQIAFILQVPLLELISLLLG